MNTHLPQSDKAANVTPETFEAAFTRSEAQRILKVSRPTLMKFVTTGKLRASKVGSQWRFQPRDIRAFLDGNRDAEPAGNE